MSPSEKKDSSSSAGGNVDSKVEKFGDESVVQSFVDAIPPEDRRLLDDELRSFVVLHASHHRPIALVSSGGTAADLEVNSVRCLDNFSTGKRGAISVEGENSFTPYILAGKCAHHESALHFVTYLAKRRIQWIAMV